MTANLEPDVQPAPAFKGAAPWPSYADDERTAADAVLASGRVNYWTGEEGRAFEREYASHLNVSHAIALANGTLALELPLRCWGIGPGDEVVVTPRSFMASVSCVILQGATPVFADVEADSGNINARSIERVLSRRTRAVIPVHLAGWPCDMAPIMELARERGLKVIEDCAQAHGAMYRGSPVGSIGDAGAFSFCQDKILTTAGEGGLLATSDDAMWRDAWAFKDHGKNWDAVYDREHPPGFRWLHESFGTNWRLTESQSAIGRLQLRKLPDWHAARYSNAARYIVAFADLDGLRVPLPASDCRHAWYKFYAYVRPEALKRGWSRDRLMTEINRRGVPCFSGSCSEIYLERAFDDTPFRPRQRLPMARQLGETSLMFLVHPTLTEADTEQMAEIAADVIRSATR
ncbi:MAG: DegT/DnrJ/EryC1/StrS aminotransferase family protein [Steroidobacteraceae bacterium]|nr:DegT/DnrJ/EryC1/StrS aminotransferase family protein [Steroidobacteraceae bacterium]